MSTTIAEVLSKPKLKLDTLFCDPDFYIKAARHFANTDQFNRLQQVKDTILHLKKKKIHVPIVAEDYVDSILSYATKTSAEEKPHFTSVELSLSDFGKLKKRVQELNKRKQKSLTNFNPVLVEPVFVNFVKNNLSVIVDVFGGYGQVTNEYKIIGYLDNYKTAKGVMTEVFSFTGENLNTFKDHAQTCGSCGVKRYRNKMYILEHNNGEKLLTGSSCVQKYFDVDMSYFKNYSAVCKLYKEMRYYKSEKLSKALSSFDIILYAQGIYEQMGYRKSSQSSSNKSILVFLLNGLQEYLPTFFDFERFKNYIKSEKAHKKAAEILNFALNLNVTNSLEAKIKDIAKAEVFLFESHKQQGRFERAVLGVAAYIPQLYLNKGTPPKPKTLYTTIGTIKEKTTVVGKCVSNTFVSTQYGPLYINVIETTIPESNTVAQVVWKTGTQQLARGTKYSIVGRVKEHSDYRGTPQTFLTRCKVEIQ